MREKISSIICQLWSVVGIISIFFISACYYAKGMVSSRAIIMTAGATVVFVFFSIYRFLYDKTNRFIKCDWKIVVILLAIIIPRSIQIKDVPIDDASVYYQWLRNACIGFQFTWKSFQGFKLASHPTLGYAGLSAIGYFLYPQFVIGVNLVILVLVCFSGIALYKIFQMILPEASQTRCMLYAIMIMNIPIYLGLFSFYSTDFGIAIFMIFAIYYLLQKKYVLAAFWTVMLIESKENAILVVAAIAGTLVLYYLITHIKSIEDKNKRIKWIVGSILALVLLMIGALLFVLSWKWGGGLLQMFQQTGGNGFAIEKDHIIVTLKDIFILNFNWLLWLMLIVLGITYRWKKGHAQLNKQHGILLIAIFNSMCIQILFFIVYRTVELPRYDCIIMVSLCMLLCVLIEDVIHSRLCKNSITVIILTLLLVQSFVTIDPVMRVFCYALETDGIARYTLRENQDDGTCFYNYQYSSKARLFETILEEAQYYGQDIFLVGTARLPFTFCEGYWDLETNSLSPDILPTAVPIKASTLRIPIKRIIAEKIPSERTTDGAIIIVQPHQYNNDRIVEQLMTLYEHIDYEAREVSDGAYGKLYYYLVYGSRNVE